MVFVVLLALMVMGVGYAAWNQKLDISVGGTTGVFSVQIDNAYAIGADGKPCNDRDGTYAEYDKREASFAILPLQPGESQVFMVFFKNCGTIPARLIRFDFDSIGDTLPPYLLFSVDGANWYSVSSDKGIDLSKTIEPGDTESVSVRFRPDVENPQYVPADDIVRFRMAPSYSQK